MKRVLYFFLAISLTTNNNVYGQDVAFSQYFSLPMLMNPAMAGTAYSPRFSLGYRNQWPSLGAGFNGGFVTYAGSYDQHFEKIKSGLGLWVSSDRIANGLMASNNIGIDYSFQIRLSKKVGLRIGIEGSYTNKYVDWNQLLFSDQIDPLRGFYQSFRVPNNTKEITPNSFSRNIFDMGAGVLVFNGKYYGGFSISHLLRPRESIIGGNESRIPIKYSVHAGAIIPFKIRRVEDVYLSPNALFLQQKNFTQINVGMLLNVKLIYGGVWFRHNIRNSDAVIILFGIRKGIFRAGYSYDLTISKLIEKTGGTHEVTLTFNIGKNDNSLNPKNRKGILNCPEILKF